jgi:hypothetical protein
VGSSGTAAGGFVETGDGGFMLFRGFGAGVVPGEVV